MTPQQTTALLRQSRAIREQHPGTILLFRTDARTVRAFGRDAKTVSELCGLTIKRQRADGGYVEAVSFPFADCEVEITKLIDAGNKAAMCEPTRIER